MCLRMTAMPGAVESDLFHQVAGDRSGRVVSSRLAAAKLTAVIAAEKFNAVVIGVVAAPRCVPARRRSPSQVRVEVRLEFFSNSSCTAWLTMVSSTSPRGYFLIGARISSRFSAISSALRASRFRRTAAPVFEQRTFELQVGVLDADARPISKRWPSAPVRSSSRISRVA